MTTTKPLERMSSAELEALLADVQQFTKVVRRALRAATRAEE